MYNQEFDWTKVDMNLLPTQLFLFEDFPQSIIKDMKNTNCLI